MTDTSPGENARADRDADSGFDLLASIRRIVNEEDGEPAKPHAAPISRAGAPARNADGRGEGQDVMLLTPDLRVDEDAGDEDAVDETGEAADRPFILRGPAYEAEDADEAAESETPSLRLDPGAGDADEEVDEPSPALRVSTAFDAPLRAPADQTRADDADADDAPAGDADWTRAVLDDEDDEGREASTVPSWIRAEPSDKEKGAKEPGRGGRITPLRGRGAAPVSPLRGRDAPRRDMPQSDLRRRQAEGADDDGESLFARRTDAAEPLPERAELQELIRATLREELSGPLGDRISSNIRRMVQREVRKAVEDALVNR